MSLDIDAIRRDLHLAASDITAPTLNKVIHDLCDEVERLRQDAVVNRSVETTLTVRDEDRLAALLDAERENTALRAEVARLRAERRLDNADLAHAYDFARDKGAALERGVVLDYLAYRIEMSHYADAIKEFINARDEIAEGIHHTLDYEELLP